MNFKAAALDAPAPTPPTSSVAGMYSSKFSLPKDDPNDPDNLSYAEIENKLLSAAKAWNLDDSGKLWYAANNVRQKITPGLYRAGYSDRTGPFLYSMINKTDDLILFKDTVSEQVVNEIVKFWNKKNVFLENGILFKRGILMRGGPGSGKTSTIQIIIKKVIEMGGIAIYPPNDPGELIGSLQMIRTIEPEVPIVLILEDFETLVASPDREQIWLSALDGQNQIPNIVYLATTNYIEKIDKRFTDRPSRFDTIVLVSAPTRDSRAAYLLSKKPDMSASRLNTYLDYSDGFSFAHLKELFVSTEIFEHDFGDTVYRLREMRDREYSSDDNDKGTDKEKPTIGFNTKS